MYELTLNLQDVSADAKFLFPYFPISPTSRQTKTTHE